MKNVAIFCSTPYQVFSAIVLRHSILDKCTVDLYIYDYFKGYEELADRVMKIQTFRAVKTCNVKMIHKRCVEDRLNRLRNMFNYKKVAESYFFKDVTYDELYYTILDPVSLIAAKYYYKKNKIIEAIQFEDGLVNYYSSNLGRRGKTAKFLLYPISIYDRRKLYLYNPDMCIANCVNSKKISLDITDITLMRELNAVFEYDHLRQINNKIIYFDSLGDATFTPKDSTHEEICKTIMEEFDNKECVVKMHPRRERNIYKELGMAIYNYQNIPFEVLCANCNMSKKVLISIWSTTLFTPKMLLNQEPYVLILYWITGREPGETTYRLIMKLRESYNNPERIMTPKNIAELKRCLKKISEEE